MAIEQHIPASFLMNLDHSVGASPHGQQLQRSTSWHRSTENQDVVSHLEFPDRLKAKIESFPLARLGFLEISLCQSISLLQSRSSLLDINVVRFIMYTKLFVKEY